MSAAHHLTRMGVEEVTMRRANTQCFEPGKPAVSGLG